MKKLLLLVALILFSSPAFSQDFLWKAVYDPPETKMEWLKESVKLASYASAVSDAKTTISAINRGMLEGDTIHNLLISRNDPAPYARTAYIVGGAYVLNLAFDYLYNKFDNKYIRLILIGTRSVHIGFQINFSIDNSTNF